MIAFLLVSIFLVSGISLLSYMYCWLDIRARRPHIISLRQITGVMDRARLIALLGKPEPGYYFKLSPDMRRALLTRYRAHYYLFISGDIVCQLGAWRYMTGAAQGPLEYVFILLAALCQGVNIAHSIHLVRKWGAQIREEIEGE